MTQNYVFAPYLSEAHIDQVRISDLMKITHLNIAFGHIIEGEVSVSHLKHLDRIAIYKSIHPNLKISLSIGGWEADGFSQAAATTQSRQKFIQSAIALLLRWDLDGIDIDWEYPCNGIAGIDHSPNDKENYTLLLQELRETLNKQQLITRKQFLLTAAVGGDADFIKGTQMNKVAEILDYVYLMTYDLRSGFTHIAGHHASMYAQSNEPQGPCAQQTVELFHAAGVPYHKMVLGIATYGRLWSGIVDDNNSNGLGQKAKTTGSYFDSFNMQDQATIEGNGFHKYYDVQANAPYLFNGDTFISFEDTTSIEAKCNYVKEHKLAGIMYWLYGDTTLFDAMYHKIK